MTTPMSLRMATGFANRPPPPRISGLILSSARSKPESGSKQRTLMQIAPGPE